MDLVYKDDEKDLKQENHGGNAPKPSNPRPNADGKKPESEKPGNKKLSSKKKKGKRQKKPRARATSFFLTVLTIGLVVVIFLYGKPFVRAAKAYVSDGKDAAWQALQDNDVTGIFRRKELYLKEEKKSFGFIKKHLGTGRIPDSETEENKYK